MKNKILSIDKFIANFVLYPFRQFIFCLWQLHVGGGFTKVRAGDIVESSHKSVCGRTPAIGPKRLLGAVHFF